ncbi:DNA-binding response regulator [Mucilaginibacter conchicola]|uniref:DNA-binding response regulator n=1 Tax=Mucilaginibacter conchicola TaxID=2303333 RepID=A0A372NXL7_9SPHI|nr:response regulator transcription factor [Mucilaginibacter conchicola]RFZ94856.1 DNA-binding response regulator [Mucilaginibacter conchicola]
MITVSIVEDHDQYRDLLYQVINDNPEFQILDSFSSAEEALKSIIINPPDIAIIDIKLKSLSGIELIQRIKSKIPQTLFLMCTAYQNNENVFTALKAGASGYIVKGSSAEEIQSAVKELYNGGAPMSPYIAKKVINLLHGKEDQNNYDLTEREIEVLSHLSKGLLYKEIADLLGISLNTVKNHCKNIYKRLHVQNRVEALNKFNA